jgi:nucleoside-diphosphate-sugar epimerase
VRLLLVGVPSLLRDRLAAELGRRHEVRDLTGDARDLAACTAAADCDVVIHGFEPGDDPVDDLDRATRTVWNLLTTTRASRYIQLSSMRIFTAYDPGWAVDERWSPRPTTDPVDLAFYGAEITSREVSRARPAECVVLRLDEVVPGEIFDRGPIQPRWLHIEDAVDAVVDAVDCEATRSRWAPVHVVRGDDDARFPATAVRGTPFEPTIKHHSRGPAAAAEPPAWPPTPGPIDGLTAPKRIVIFGAGGPLAATTAVQLRDDHVLRLTDIQPLAHFQSAPPQMVGAPRPTPPGSPHEERQVDVTDPAAVADAVRDMDCVINCAVVRHDPVVAFRVNILGAYNTMRAAVDAGIPRVVHTGPVLTLAPHPVGYTADRAVPDSAPPRPGDDVYFVTKLIAQEICRIFAEAHSLPCPILLFCGFVGSDPHRQGQPTPFTVSWDDAGRAMAAAAHVASLPEPAPILHVMADSPHDKYTNTAVKSVLGWEPKDRLDHLWQR